MLLLKSLFTLILVFILFIIIPTSILPTDIIALIMALFLIIISRLEAKQIISKIDFELILYLLGIFIIAGALDILGVVQFLGEIMSNLSGGDIFSQLIIILWISSFLSSAIDNIPITKLLIPVINTISNNYPSAMRHQFFFCLAIGANWGDNLTPLGDNILVVQIAEQNKRPISFKQFFKIGFITTLYQITLASIYYTLIFKFLIGIMITLSIVILIITLFIIIKIGPKKLKNIIEKVINRFRNIFIE
jgi:Na+/H+ antiporter NhaD/arsenite permease-like protein